MTGSSLIFGITPFDSLLLRQKNSRNHDHKETAAQESVEDRRHQGRFVAEMPSFIIFQHRLWFATQLMVQPASQSW